MVLEYPNFDPWLSTRPCTLQLVLMSKLMPLCQYDNVYRACSTALPNVPTIGTCVGFMIGSSLQQPTAFLADPS